MRFLCLLVSMTSILSARDGEAISKARCAGWHNTLAPQTTVAQSKGTAAMFVGDTVANICAVRAQTGELISKVRPVAHFLMRLPISSIGYTVAKACSTLVTFLVPWLTLLISGLVLAFWNPTVVRVLSAEFGLILVIVGLKSFLQSRKGNFI